MTNSNDFEMLALRRKQKGFTQTKMAQYFGLVGKNARKEVAQWERGKRPADHHRNRFFEYLADELNLKDSPEILFTFWETVRRVWGWSELSETEKQTIYGDTSNETVDWENISPEELLARINSKNPGRSSSATRAAIDLVEQGKLPVPFLIDANHAPYWLVRKLVLEYLVKRENDDILNQLVAFQDTSYHVSQSIIREYIKGKFRSGKLNRTQLSLSAEILDHLSKAPKVTDISKSKNIKLWEEIREKLSTMPVE
jgi:transcriptional regulator with XRE-family HTH domain